MNKKIRNIVLIIIIVFLGGIILYPKIKPFLVSKLGPRGIKTPMLRQTQQKINATGYLISPQHLSEFYKTVGTLKPDEEVDLSFEASGKIVGIYIKEGAGVKKGDLLAKINDQPLQAELQKLEAELKLAEAKEYRQKNLLDKDAISQESYDQVQTDVQTINADINLVKARIAQTELRAPFEGKIGLRYVSEGAFTTSSTKIARLVKTSPLKIEFSIPERYATEITIGYPLVFEVDGKSYTASVYAIDPKIDIATRVVTMRAMYSNLHEELKPGRFTNITLELSRIDNAIAIPTEALIPEMEGERVFIYQNGRAQSVKVTTGLRTESKIQITDGIKSGDTLLVTGILQLRQSLPVVLDSVIVNK